MKVIIIIGHHMQLCMFRWLLNTYYVYIAISMYETRNKINLKGVGIEMSMYLANSYVSITY